MKFSKNRYIGIFIKLMPFFNYYSLLLHNLIRNFFYSSINKSMIVKLALIIQLICCAKSLEAQVIQEQIPSSIESQLLDATKYELIGNLDKALELLEKMRSIPETKATVYYKLARIYLSKSRLEDALNAILESTISDSTNKWTLIFEANLLESIGRYSESAKVYEQLARLEPNNYTMYDLAALNYTKAELTSNAIAVLDKAQTKFGLMPELCIKKAKLFVALKDTKKAIELLNASSKEYPKHIELLQNQYQIYQLSGNQNMMDATLEKIKILDPSTSILTPIKNNSQAGYLDKVLEEIHNTKDLDALIKSLIPFIQSADSNQLKKLIKISDELVQMYNNDVKVWALRGDLFFISEQFLESIRAYSKAVEIDNVPYSVWENYIVSMIKMNHWKSIKDKANTALDYYPNQAFLYYSLALSQLQLMETEEALIQLKQFELMIKSNSDRMNEAEILKASILEAQKKYSESEKIWNQLLSQTANDLAIIEYCFYVTKRSSNIPKDKLNMAFQNRNLSLSYLLSRKAAIFYQLKEKMIAKNDILKCLELPSGQNPENYELAYNILKDLGEVESSKLLLLKARELSDNKNYYNELINKIN